MKSAIGDRIACNEYSIGLAATCVMPRISAEPGACENATMARPRRNIETNHVRGRVNVTSLLLTPLVPLGNAVAMRPADSVRWPPLGESCLHLRQDLSLLQDFSRPTNHAGKRLLRDIDGKSSVLCQTAVKSAKKRAAPR